MVSPGLALSTACWRVFHGVAELPAAASLPPVATKKVLRTSRASSCSTNRRRRLVIDQALWGCRRGKKGRPVHVARYGRQGAIRAYGEYAGRMRLRVRTKARRGIRRAVGGKDSDESRTG